MKAQMKLLDLEVDLLLVRNIPLFKNKHRKEKKKKMKGYGI